MSLFVKQDTPKWNSQYSFVIAYLHFNDKVDTPLFVKDIRFDKKGDTTVYNERDTLRKRK